MKVGDKICYVTPFGVLQGRVTYVYNNGLVQVTRRGTRKQTVVRIKDCYPTLEEATRAYRG